MRRFLCLVLTVILLPLTGRPARAAEWPDITRQQKPWTYWWWMGSAVDTNNIARQLALFHDAGLGGVHIIPIYGARGWESNYISYLSPKWMDMLAYTVKEAGRLDMGVDMTTGTGWCFGGPTVTREEANAVPVPKVVNGDYTISEKPTAKVKRAAPGDEGWMLNPFYPPAMTNYLQWFSDAFANAPKPWPRAQYQDSYEYESAWAPDLFAQFERRRGYRLQDQLAALFGNQGGTDLVGRVKCDYRETLSDIMVEQTIPAWVDWSHAHGFLTRYQAHGSPANLLDLYACADIPETEMFHLDRDKLVSKFASSAGHVAGRALISSETGTWLREHFTETLADMKGLIDDMFLSGINHVFYHGCCYSPEGVDWPGWVFYASFEMNPRNPIWRDTPALNACVARCQSLLQSGRPDNDILLYWPIYDYWSEPEGMQQELEVHAEKWLEGQPVGQAAQWLFKRGFQFDYVSDRQLAALQGIKQTIVVPRCHFMPVATFASLLRLANAGATIVFDQQLPDDVPGLADLDNRRAQLKSLRDESEGRFLVGPLEAELARTFTPRETMFDNPGIMCVRRADDLGHIYFIANRGKIDFDGLVELAAPMASAVIMDPATGETGNADISGQRARLQLAAGQSLLLRALTISDSRPPEWKYWTNAAAAIRLSGDWQIDFVSGGPVLPPAFVTNQLGSWTRWPIPEAQRFAGTARYTLRFDSPPSLPDASWRLDLGDVRQSARVRLNGRDLGTLIAPPFQLVINSLKPTDNVLDIEVTSVAANRIRDLDRRKVKWKNFHDINFVNVDYQPFDASHWPLADCGLLGPVTLTPVRDQILPTTRQ